VPERLTGCADVAMLKIKKEWGASHPHATTWSGLGVRCKLSPVMSGAEPQPKTVLVHIKLRRTLVVERKFIRK